MLESDAGGRMDADNRWEAGFFEWLALFEQLRAAEQWERLELRGTDFQKSVWRALLDIPFGSVTSYGRIAKAIGRSGASRAVGAAVGANPVAVLIPCHRVLPSSGGLGQYRWGAQRKAALLLAERVPGANLGSLFV
jgi:AraC family transcriptional regulator of adaptative response/methylated-DNA-[protein]-cysteine methyltransferase